MIFGKKKEQPFEQKKEGIDLDVVIVLWNGQEIATTITCESNIGLDQMVKNALRDGLFMPNESKIVRVNEIRWKDEVMN